MTEIDLTKIEGREIYGILEKRIYLGGPAYEPLYDAFLRRKPDFFKVPERYENATFEMDNPSPSQDQLITLLNALLEGEHCEDKNPLNPRVSIYLYGSVGRGKTHLFSAYANVLEEKLQKEIKKREKCINDDTKRSSHVFIYKANSRLEELANKTKSLSKILNDPPIESKFTTAAFSYSEFDSKEARAHFVRGGAAAYFDKGGYLAAVQNYQQAQQTMQRINQEAASLISTITPTNFLQFLLGEYKEKFERMLNSGAPYTRNHILFVDFERLFEIYHQNNIAVREIARAPILIIDDVHPKGEEVRAKVIQDIFEMRYNTTQSSATFVTSNLSPEDLVKVGKYDEKVAQRLVSRCNEMFIPFEIDDTSDYRSILAEKKKKELKKFLTKKSK